MLTGRIAHAQNQNVNAGVPSQARDLRLGLSIKLLLYCAMPGDTALA